MGAENMAIGLEFSPLTPNHPLPDSGSLQKHKVTN
jgi:hypothetical protein